MAELTPQLRQEVADFVRDTIEVYKTKARTPQTLQKMEQIHITQEGHPNVVVDGYFDMVEGEDLKTGVFTYDDTMILLYQELESLGAGLELIGGPGKYRV